MRTETFCNIVLTHRAKKGWEKRRNLHNDIWADKRGQLMTAVPAPNKFDCDVSRSWQEGNEQNSCYRRACIHSAVTTVWANHTYTQPEVSKKREEAQNLWVSKELLQCDSGLTKLKLPTLRLFQSCITATQQSIPLFQHAGSGNHAQAWFNKPTKYLTVA